MRHLLFFFSTRTGLASHSGKKTSIMKLAARSRAISSPTILLFSSDSRRRGCLTGLEPSRTCSLCSANSFGTPGMSLGDHAKMSRFSRRKSASLTSYLLFRFAPNDGKPFWVLGVKRYLLCFLGRLEGALGITLLGIRGQGRLLAGHGHDSVQHFL